MICDSRHGQQGLRQTRYSWEQVCLALLLNDEQASAKGLRQPSERRELWAWELVGAPLTSPPESETSATVTSQRSLENHAELFSSQANSYDIDTR